MNDPYKSQRLALCKQQTMLHNANCDGCKKIANLWNDYTLRTEMCKKCDIGAEQRKIGEELLKCTRPRVKAPAISNVNEFQKMNQKAKRPELDETKINSFLTLRSSGLSIVDIAKRWGYNEKAIRNFAKKFNLVTSKAKKPSIYDNLSVEQYLELREKYKSNRKISTITGYSITSLYEFRKKHGLIKGAV